MGEELGPGDRLSGLMRAARGIAVAIADREGRIVEWSDGAEALLGYPASEAVGADLTLGHDPAELAAAARRAGASDGLAALLAAGDAAEVREWTMVRRDGGRVVVAETVAAILDQNGALTGYAALGRDVSRRRRMEDEREAVRRVALLVAEEADPEHVLGRVAEEAGRLLRAAAAGVARYDGAIAVQAGAWSAMSSAEARVGVTIPLDAPGAVAEVHRTGRGAHATEGPAASRALVAAPVRVGGRLWGALWAGAPAGAALGADDAESLARLADLAGLAIANAEARRSVVNDALASIFRGDLDIEGTLELVVQAARQAAGADRATCYVTDPGSERVRSVHTTELDPARRAFIEAARGKTRSQLPVWQLQMRGDGPTLVIEDVRAHPLVPSAVADRLGARARGAAARAPVGGPRRRAGVARLDLPDLPDAAQLRAGGADRAREPGGHGGRRAGERASACREPGERGAGA